MQPLPRGGYQPYNPPYRKPYNPAEAAYNNDQGGEEEDEEQDPYYHGYPSQYYPQQPSQLAQNHHGYHTSHSEDVELRSPGVARRFPRDVITDEDEKDLRGRMDSP